MNLPTPAPAPSGALEIRDIRGPVPLGPGLLAPLAVAAGTLALLALALFLWRRRRRRPRISAAPPPEEVALASLEATRALLAEGRDAEFAVAVAAAVRRYLERRFGVAAPRQTTEEFLRSLVDAGSASPLAGHADLLADVLRRKDLATFARAPLTREEMESMLEAARRLVRETRPPEEAAA